MHEADVRVHTIEPTGIAARAGAGTLVPRDLVPAARQYRVVAGACRIRFQWSIPRVGDWEQGEPQPGLEAVSGGKCSGLRVIKEGGKESEKEDTSASLARNQGCVPVVQSRVGHREPSPNPSPASRKDSAGKH